MIKTYINTMNGVSYHIKADDSLALQAQRLFDLIGKIPNTAMHNGYKLEIGFNVFFSPSGTIKAFGLPI